MVDLAAEGGSWSHALSSMHLCQAVVMAWLPSGQFPEIAQLPLSRSNVAKLIQRGAPTRLTTFVTELRHQTASPKQKDLSHVLRELLGTKESEKVLHAVDALPLATLTCSITSSSSSIKQDSRRKEFKVNVSANFNFGSRNKRKRKYLDSHYIKCLCDLINYIFGTQS